MICIATIPISEEIAYHIYTKNVCMMVDLISRGTIADKKKIWIYLIRLIMENKCLYRISYTSDFRFDCIYYYCKILHKYFIGSVISIYYDEPRKELLIGESTSNIYYRDCEVM